MKVRRASILILGIASLISLAISAPAQAGRPLAVVAFSGYSEWRADVGYIGRISGQPDLAAGLDFLARMVFAQGQDFPGLDKQRPWGAVIQVDEEKLARGVNVPEHLLTGYAIVPVTDLDGLLEALQHLIGQPEDVGDGVLRIGRPERPGYVKQVGSWACVAPKPEALASLPADPARAIQGLADQYDLAVQVNLAAVPEAVRQKVVEGIRAQGEADLQRRPGEPEEEYLARRLVGQYFLGIATGLAKDVEQFTVGWSLDHEAGTASIELAVTAMPDTPTARHFAALGRSTTAFGGFLQPQATVCWNVAGTLPEIDSTNLADAVDAIRSRALEDFEGQGRPAAEAELGRKLINRLLDVVQKTIQTSRFDGGGLMVLKPDALTVAVGGMVADGGPVDQTIRTLAEAVGRENPAFADRAIRMDAGREGDVTFHTVSLPIPPDARRRDELVELVGDELQVVVGVGPKSVYLAAGRDPMETLRRAIQQSASQRSGMVPPVRMTVDVGALTRFVADVGEPPQRERAAAVAELLEQGEGQDHLRVVASAIDRGVRFRLEVEKGILEAVGKAAHQRRQARRGRPVEAYLESAAP